MAPPVGSAGDYRLNISNAIGRNLNNPKAVAELENFVDLTFSAEGRDQLAAFRQYINASRAPGGGFPT